MSAVSKPPNAGKGRPRGASNKVTVAVKDAILHALDEAGGTSYLAQVAKDDPKTFCALLGKLVPRAVTPPCWRRHAASCGARCGREAAS